MKIGIIDADLLDKGTRHPNLALMKISGYYKKENEVVLLDSYDDIPNYDKVFISKVFDFTKTPDLSVYDNIEIGGTGFFGIEAKDLPCEIEHHMPDYHLYDKYIENEIARGVRPSKFNDYKDGSIGFLTRGCFRKCPFCVNRKYDKPVKHSEIDEFLDKDRKYIYFWDDNFLAYPKWKEELEKVKAVNKPFEFRQGLDIRLMTDEKAEMLNSMRYRGDWMFAFDNIKDRDLIERKLKIWKKYCKKQTRLYVLVAYDSQDVDDIVNAFERIKILMKYGCIPYIMRYKEYENSEMRGMYITLARWCNQVSFYKKNSFRQYCTDVSSNGVGSSAYRYMTDFESKYPDVARQYFDLRFEELNEY